MPVAAGLHYEVHGREGDPPLILSSGLGGAGAYWAQNLPALSQRFRVITYDQRGTGRTGGELPADLTLADMTDDLIGLMDGLASQARLLDRSRARRSHRLLPRRQAAAAALTGSSPSTPGPPSMRSRRAASTYGSGAAARQWARSLLSRPTPVPLPRRLDLRARRRAEGRRGRPDRPPRGPGDHRASRGGSARLLARPRQSHLPGAVPRLRRRHARAGARIADSGDQACPTASTSPFPGAVTPVTSPIRAASRPPSSPGCAASPPTAPELRS